MAKKSIFNASAFRLKPFGFAALAGAFLCLYPLSVNAEKNVNQVAARTESKEIVKTDTIQQKQNTERESIFGGNRPLDTSHFTWGADLGASIDLTANDMSTFDLDFILGYKSKLFKIIGLGAGIHRTVQKGDNFIPVYALIRTSFTKRPSLLFFNARLGYSFNTVNDSPTFGDFNSALGCGINLYQTSKAKTYIILSAAYRYFNQRHREYISSFDQHYIWIAQLQFGVNF